MSSGQNQSEIKSELTKRMRERVKENECVDLDPETSVLDGQFSSEDLRFVAYLMDEFAHALLDIFVPREKSGS